jgi:hypothetical protein
MQVPYWRCLFNRLIHQLYSWGSHRNRPSLKKTTRVLLYGAMGFGITLALLLLALVLGTSTAQATQVTRTVSFSVPIHTPAEACVAVNREPKCSPVVDQVVTTTLSAILSETENIQVTDGAPSFTNCDLLAKTADFYLQVDSTASITVTGVSPPINQTVSPDPIGSPATVEVCIRST